MVPCRSRVLGLVAAVVSCCTLAGCGGANTPDTGNVSGVVTYNGAPLSDVMVTFVPSNGRPASGPTDAAGKYTLSTFGTDDGAVLGEHKITITSAQADIPMPGTPEEAQAAPKAPFPQSYMSVETSTLTATVESGSNEINLELTD